MSTVLICSRDGCHIEEGHRYVIAPKGYPPINPSNVMHARHLSSSDLLGGKFEAHVFGFPKPKPTGAL